MAYGGNQCRYVFRMILQVGVDRNDDVSGSCAHRGENGGALPEVFFQIDDFDRQPSATKTGKKTVAFVRASVIDINDFIREAS